jgi:hypothetical protein
MPMLDPRVAEMQPFGFRTKICTCLAVKPKRGEREIFGSTNQPLEDGFGFPVVPELLVDLELSIGTWPINFGSMVALLMRVWCWMTCGLLRFPIERGTPKR